MALTKTKMEGIVKTFLKAFNRKKVVLNDDTVLSTVISTDNGYSGSSTQTIFKNAVIETLHTAKVEAPKFPDEWQELTVKNFVDEIIK